MMAAPTFGVGDLARRYRDGSLDPRTATEAYLDAIDRRDPHLGAFQVVFHDRARLQAGAATDALASGARIGPLHGVPFALKDIVDVEGRQTTAGSAHRRGRIAPASATIARRLLAAGGVLVGKTKTVEFALGGWGTNQHMGTPTNPWDLVTARVPGGSSSGSGVAIAASMAACAIGTDTGGSVRIPASLCGIVGLKTTEGLLPTDGIVPLSHTLDTPGPMARSVEDVTLMFDTLTGRGPLDIDDDWRTTSGLYRELQRGVAGMRCAAISDRERAAADPDVLAAYDRSLEVMASLGAHIEQVELPITFDAMKDMTFVIVTAEAWFHHGHLFDDASLPLDEFVRSRGMPGKTCTAASYLGALAQRQADQARFLAAFDPYDALLTPSTPVTAPTKADVDEETTPAHYTRAGNYLGLCGLSVPNGVDRLGLPTGLQIVGRAFDEARVLRIGAAFEAATGPFAQPDLHVIDTPLDAAPESNRAPSCN